MARERLPTTNCASKRHTKGNRGSEHVGAEKIPPPGKSCSPTGHIPTGHIPTGHRRC